MGTRASRSGSAGLLCCSAPSGVAAKQVMTPDFTDLRTASRRRGVTQSAVSLPVAGASRSSGNYCSPEGRRKLSTSKAPRCGQVAHRKPEPPRSDVSAAEVTEKMSVATTSRHANPPRRRLASDASAPSVRTVAHKPIQRPRPCWSDGMFNERSTDHAGRINGGAFPIFAVASSTSCADGGCAGAGSAM